ncbi:MAG TPA: hypothetical protein VNU97_16895 [Rhizomicrobium sp.]|jgi:hypothetical protein|nr:hypothetical protein [Rhizomicrobium sp.]
MPAHYDYLHVTLERGRPAWAAFAAHIHGTVAPALAAEGGEMLGLFQGQLGFASTEAIVLLRWPDAGHGRVQELSPAPGAVALHWEKLMPTVRPEDGKRLKPGGIYVHRWFTVDAASAADFIALSNRAWENFEGSYDTEIFGLFAAEAKAEDRYEGALRLLLLTYYASHDVWEKSRDQTRDPQGLFVKRHALTRSTIGRSSTLVVPA